MKSILRILLATLIVLPGASLRSESLDKLIPQCTEIVKKMNGDDMINQDLLKAAKGVVIMNVTSFSIGIGGSGGDGILLARTKDGWSGPCEVTTSGGTIGIDFGGADNDYVILLMTDAAIGKWANKEDFGSSSASAVCGPKGGAAVDATMKDKEFYVYIWNKGAKLGANFGGFSVDIPAGPNADFYEKPMVSAKDIVNNDVKVPDSKKDMLTRLYGLLK